jgi:hypothetical protein
VPAEATQDIDGGLVWLKGVCLGRALTETVWADLVESSRYMLRSTGFDGGQPLRIGEVFGADGSFQACTVKGDLVCKTRSLTEAARRLEELAKVRRTKERGVFSKTHIAA